MPGKNNKRSFYQTGIAISLILAAVALLAAMGALIAYSTRIGGQLSSHNADVADAMTLINQMSNIREGIKAMVARGVPLETISLDTNNGTAPSTGYSINTTGLYNPSLGGTEPQVPPQRANEAYYPSYYTWHLATDGAGNPMVKLKNVGTTAGADLVVTLAGVRKGVCEQINKILNGTSASTWPTITPASGTTGYSVNADWGNRPSSTMIDLSAVAGMDKLEQCIRSSESTSGNSVDGVYYAVIKAG